MRCNTKVSRFDVTTWKWERLLSTILGNIAKVEESIYADRQKIIHDICDKAGIGYCTCQQILTEDLKMYRIEAKFISRSLTNDQKQIAFIACTELKNVASEDKNVFPRVITHNESLIYSNDPETKQQSFLPNEKGHNHHQTKNKGILNAFFFYKT